MMPHRRILAVVAVVALVVVACDEARRPPPRPLAVPSTAAWAPAADERGWWIDCWRVADELKAHWTVPPAADADVLFDCSIFDERGAIQKRGRFRLSDKAAGGALVPPADAHRPLRYRGFDGARLQLDEPQVLAEEPPAAR